MESISALRSHLSDAKETSELEKLERLSPDDNRKLADFLLGRTSIDLEQPRGLRTVTPEGDVSIRSGDAEWLSTDVSTIREDREDNARAVTYNVRSQSDQIFKFVGISLTKTRVWGEYVTGSGKVLKTRGSGSQVVHNYQPLTDVSTWDYAPQLSAGKVLFRAKITVKRGPAPGLGGNWSTKESTQYFRASGPGVYAQGWM